MRKRMYIFILILLILSTDVVSGNGNNKTRISQSSQNRHISRSPSKSERPKRALLDEEDHPFWPNRGKKELSNDVDPFWATRGRRESFENYLDYDKPLERDCDNCYPVGNHDAIFGNVKHAREDVSPFWGMRGRRDSDEIDDQFWGSRGRRQENDPFWANRGRRQEDPPFWGHRGRRDEEPFWGNRGRRQETPFWGNRGRRENDDPFWGNRGRREEPEPFWGNRGRRDEYEPFWGNRGRRKETATPFWSSQETRKQDLKESILNAINVVEGDIENLSRLRRSNEEHSPFWPNKSGKLSHLSPRPRRYNNFFKSNMAQSSEPGTVLDNRMYAEQPGYILVTRNSRSSGEDSDPYYISRGKKLYRNFDYEKAARDRRGAIEEIVKSVRNDPYFIARGKKDTESIVNSTLSQEEFLKARELICATIDLIMLKDEKNKTKRNVDSERDRRTILKKLAAQLQIDPYFVSRGKKSDPSTDSKETSGTIDESLEDFIDEVANKCN